MSVLAYLTATDQGCMRVEFTNIYKAVVVKLSNSS